MLALMRKAGGFVRLETAAGDVIWVGVMEVDGGRVRLSFDAPDSTRIHRHELVDPEQLPEFVRCHPRYKGESSNA